MNLETNSQGTADGVKVEGLLNDEIDNLVLEHGLSVGVGDKEGDIVAL